MREILFRGQRINRDTGYHRTEYKNGDWVYGLVTKLYDKRFENLPAEMADISGVSGIEVDYKTICQYTGLTDSNSKKIFEGDIVKARFQPQNFKIPPYAIGKIIFECGTFKISVCVSKNSSLYKVYEDKNITSYSVEHNFLDRGYRLEVIGNIYDNPELLKDGDEE